MSYYKTEGGSSSKSYHQKENQQKINEQIIYSLLSFFSSFFTSDPLVTAKIHSVVPFLPLLACIFALHGFICVSEGLLLGQTDLSFLGKVYGVRSILCGCQEFAVKWCGKHWDDESMGGLSLFLSGEECAGAGTGGGFSWNGCCG